MASSSDQWVTRPSASNRGSFHIWYPGGSSVVTVDLRAAVFLNALVNSSKYLYNSMLTAVLKSSVLFFDTNPVGRILNRFSRDIGIMDELLPDEYLDAVDLVLFSVGAVVLPSILIPWIMLPAAPLVFIFALIGRYYLKTSRDLRRLEGINRNPVRSHFSDTMMGLVTIRTYRKEDAFIEALFRFGFFKICTIIVHPVFCLLIVTV